ncbi:MAG: hypothetical protein HOP28_18540 [Gemmatimonadales bacterium]|nr:hypothetical protein [Gemmatimonadales bacterium]
MIRRVPFFAFLLAISSCGSSPKRGADRTQREKDSIIGESKLPGAQGVKKALEAADSAAARRAIEDTVGRTHVPPR